MTPGVPSSSPGLRAGDSKETARPLFFPGLRGVIFGQLQVSTHLQKPGRLQPKTPMTAHLRQEAIRSISASDPRTKSDRTSALTSSDRLPDTFGLYVFDDAVQRDRLPTDVYIALRRVVESGARLEENIAGEVARAMKDWAIGHGATHYTHWFQPMTGSTAEKHDSFLEPTGNGQAILKFSGSQLVQGEPDASSFPSGGLRATFEARGYTAWDATSPAFVRKGPGGGTLTIPTVFCSWHGEALDKKTPLLRSCEALSKSATRILNLIGETDIKRVMGMAGCEQEYFLVDREFYKLRPDLIACNRTVFGAPPYKGQEFDDHYFGNISPRVLEFMQDLERELWLLGVPVKTRHNEVAPSQFELAPIYQGISVSVDQNMLTMELIREVAARHGMAALLHEKPFAGLNGSGKHLNYSVATDTGRNLFEPGKTPHKNLSFILFLTAFIRGCDKHQDLLRASIASAGNDHRLGANEAPPAILSVFLGTQLEGVVKALIDGTVTTPTGVETVRLGVDSLPNLPKDVSDRNRTSPMAFTGNKFEFRALGSAQSAAYPATFLNLILAESLDYLSDKIEHLGGFTEANAQTVVSACLRQHSRILFSGDNYTEEWTQEAKQRGLLNLPTTPEALQDWAMGSNIELFEKYGVFTRSEAESRFHVQNETYANKIKVEARACLDIADTLVLPAATQHQLRAAQATEKVKDLLGDDAASSQLGALAEITTLLAATRSASKELRLQVRALEDQDLGESEAASAYCERVVPLMSALREVVDALETSVDDDLWPLPKYREMLFVL
ncbi:MAG: glutamine synthetase [Planctomycetota bacterium]|jgi:glutamine synthetase